MRPADASGRAGRRPGFTLAELLVVLTCASVLAALFFGVLSAQLKLARHTAQRTLDHDALRTASAILGGELRRATPADVYAVAPDSIALRAFRGMAVVCAPTPQGPIVHYRGDRVPDPSKDSVLWLGAAGAEQLAAIASVAPANANGCPAVAPGALLILRTQPVIDRRGVLLVFESGSYFLSARALRYRIGAAGRQPLTADLLDQNFTFFARRGPYAIDYQLAPSAGTAPARRGSVHYPARP